MTEIESNKSKAQIHNIRAAKTVSETVKSTLGPMGMDKLMLDGGGNVIVTRLKKACAMTVQPVRSYSQDNC